MMTNLAKNSGLATLAFSRKTLLEMFEDVPEDKRTYQPFDGANHALWIMGHLALTDDFFLTTFKPRDTKMSELWNKLFGMGSKPIADAAVYPSMTEITDTMAGMREELIGWFGGLSDDQLTSPLPENWRTFAPSHAALMSTIAWHEGMHTGQLTVVRKSLGIAPKIG